MRDCLYGDEVCFAPDIQFLKLSVCGIKEFMGRGESLDGHEAAFQGCGRPEFTGRWGLNRNNLAADFELSAAEFQVISHFVCRDPENQPALAAQGQHSLAAGNAVNRVNSCVAALFQVVEDREDAGEGRMQKISVISGNFIA